MTPPKTVTAPGLTADLRAMCSERCGRCVPCLAADRIAAQAAALEAAEADAASWKERAGMAQHHYYLICDAVCRESTSVEDVCNQARATRAKLEAAELERDAALAFIRLVSQRDETAPLARAWLAALPAAPPTPAYDLTVPCDECDDKLLLAAPPEGEAPRKLTVSEGGDLGPAGQSDEPPPAAVKADAVGEWLASVTGLRARCVADFMGGYDGAEYEAFVHGMHTVCNVLAGSPPWKPSEAAAVKADAVGEARAAFVVAAHLQVTGCGCDCTDCMALFAAETALLAAERAAGAK